MKTLDDECQYWLEKVIENDSDEKKYALCFPVTSFDNWHVKVANFLRGKGYKVKTGEAMTRFKLLMVFPKKN